MRWQEFELLVGEVFRRKGFAIQETGGGGADGGIDLRLTKGSEKFLVQCKQWRAYKVSVNVVRELFGVMAAEGAVGGFVVTSGVFTEDAKSFAKGRNIELVDGKKLKYLIDGLPSSSSNEIASNKKEPVLYTPVLSATQELFCPRCNGSMVKRIAKKGANQGQEFWGCAAFPKCRGIRAI